MAVVQVFNLHVWSGLKTCPTKSSRKKSALRFNILLCRLGGGG